MRRALALSTALLVVACAKEEPPPGTNPDNAPPRAVTVDPTYGASRPGFEGSARVRFDEPLSNPRNLGRDLAGSPAGRYEVDPSRNGIDVRPEEGWQEGVVYYLRLPSGVSDLLRNQTTEPVEWLFSTGPEIRDTEVTGRVIDRVTARGTQGTRVLFLGADSVPYTAVSDTGGAFRLPGLPYGSYEAVGFTDQNRNFTYDEDFEPGGTAPFTLDASGERAEVEVLMLPADTTPPVLASAAAQDSLTLSLEFDDPLDPEAELADVTLTVRDSVSQEELEVEEFDVGDLTPPDSLAADTAVAPDSLVAPDTVPAPEDTLDVPDADTAAAAADTAAVPAPPDLEPAPVYVSVRLAAPLAAGTYRVAIDGVVNLRDLVGGGEAVFTYEPPPPEEDDAGQVDEDGEDPEAGQREPPELPLSPGSSAPDPANGTPTP